MTFLLCDPGWYVYKPDIQNKSEDNTHTHTQTHTQYCTSVNSLIMGFLWREAFIPRVLLAISHVVHPDFSLLERKFSGTNPS